MIKITKNIVLNLYKKMTLATGGTVGIRDEGMLESALEAPYQSFDGVELYPTLNEKAARLGYGLTANHPFIDGNKRIGVYAMLVFLEVNGVLLPFTDSDIEFLAMRIADGSYKYEDVLNFINSK